MTQEMRKRKGFPRGLLVVILALAFVAPGLAGKERTGAHIKVVKRDGKIVDGELLSVKGENLVVLDRATSGEITESLREIRTIRILRKSDRVLWGIVGGAVGALAYALAAAASPDPNPDSPNLDPASGAVLGGLVGTAGAIGLVVDGQTINIKKTDQAYIAKIGARLRKYARDRS
jgi:hypothetical protein